MIPPFSLVGGEHLLIFRVALDRISPRARTMGRPCRQGDERGGRKGGRNLSSPTLIAPTRFFLRNLLIVKAAGNLREAVLDYRY